MTTTASSLNVADALKARRATKQFVNNTEMPEDDFKYLIDQAILSPTALNLQH